MLDALLRPRGVAIIGASQNPTKLGYGAARNLVMSGYIGGIYFVNPRGGELFERPIYADVASVPDPVDLAVILIPAPAVPQALEACGRRGIPAVIIGSGGFREVGPEGADLEQRCLDIARSFGIRILGPNCIGLLDTHLPIDTTFLPLPGPIPGDIAFISHSGAICEAVIDWARGQGFGLSRLISLGNQMDLTEADVLSAVADDPNTQVVAMYLEGIGNGRAFVESAARVTRSKPVVAIKVGRSERGRAAVASHTGAMAGEDAAFDAAFRRAGVLRAGSSEEVFDWSRALAWCPLPRGRRVAVLTNAGGPGAIAVDALTYEGLEMANLSEATRARLRGLLPTAASAENPVDMLASAGPSEYGGCLQALLRDPEVDAVLVILPPPPMTTAAEVAGALIPQVRSAGKPVVVALMGEQLIAHAASLFRQAHVPDYRFPEKAASALRVLVERAEQLARPEEAALELPGTELNKAKALLAESPAGLEGFLAPHVASRLVRLYGIPTVESVPTRTVEEAIEAAERVGYPVVAKVASPQIVHKFDAGGVVLNLNSAGAVSEAFHRVVAVASGAGAEDQGPAALIEPMVPEGQDIIVGCAHDPQFGPLVMFGAGGVEVEELADVAFALAPLSLGEAEQLLRATAAGRRLGRRRNQSPRARKRVLDVLQRLSRLACDLTEELEEVEINPLRVQSSEVVAIDVRVRLRSSEWHASVERTPGAADRP